MAVNSAPLGCQPESFNALSEVFSGQGNLTLVGVEPPKSKGNNGNGCALN